MTREQFLNSLPDCKMSRVIIHWTGGGYLVSPHDKECYHYIVGYADGRLQVVQGDNSIKANVSTNDADGYAAHVKGFNTGSIGIAAACMADATESPFNVGPYPLTQEQWLLLAVGAAEMCKKYNIAVTPQTVLQHGEVEENCGKPQDGKWDICKLPWQPSWSKYQVGDAFRTEVSRRL